MFLPPYVYFHCFRVNVAERALNREISTNWDFSRGGDRLSQARQTGERLEAQATFNHACPANPTLNKGTHNLRRSKKENIFHLTHGHTLNIALT